MLIPARTLSFRKLSNDHIVAIRCIVALSVVTAAGTAGFMLVEEWGLWKALFFTLITITTVGYGDQGLSTSGQVFAAIVLILGIGTATYSLSSLVQVAVAYQSSWRRRMKNHINKLTDHFIIAGHGRIGRTVCERLRESGIPFVVVDPKMEQVEAAIEHDHLAIQGDSTEDEVLIEAGIERARGIICATNSDAENVFVTLSARGLNPSMFIAARASTEAAGNKMKRAGATLVVSPYISAGHQITDAILRPQMADSLLGNSNTELELTVLRIDEKTAFANKTVKHFGTEFPEIVVVAINSLREGTVVGPVASRLLEVGDEVTVAGRNSELYRIHLAVDRKLGSSRAATNA